MSAWRDTPIPPTSLAASLLPWSHQSGSAADTAVLLTCDLWVLGHNPPIVHSDLSRRPGGNGGEVFIYSVCF